MPIQQSHYRPRSRSGWIAVVDIRRTVSVRIPVRGLHSHDRSFVVGPATWFVMVAFTSKEL